MSSQTQKPSSGRRRCLAIAAICGLVAAIACAIGAVVDPDHFFPGYLVAAVWGWSLSIGGLILTTLFHLTGGRWGAAGRGWFEAAARAMPLVALLFVPLAFGLPHLYPWTEADYFAGMERVSHRQAYYTTDFFLIRSAVYFGIWIVLSLLLAGWPGRRRRRSTRKESVEEGASPAGGQLVAGLGALALLLTVSWASIDWIMSLNPMFASSLFGALVGIGAMLSGMALVVAGVTLGGAGYHASAPSRDVLGDLANLLLAMVMLWAYFSFSQFLLMWNGNLPEEAHYYQVRSHGGWQLWTILIAVGGFMVPLALLLSARLKRAPRFLSCLAVWLIVIRGMELDWFVLPHFSPRDFQGTLWAVVAQLAIGGWLLAFLIWDGPRVAMERSGNEEKGHE